MQWLQMKKKWRNYIPMEWIIMISPWLLYVSMCIQCNWWLLIFYINHVNYLFPNQYKNCLCTTIKCYFFLIFSHEMCSYFHAAFYASPYFFLYLYLLFQFLFLLIIKFGKFSNTNWHTQRCWMPYLMLNSFLSALLVAFIWIGAHAMYRLIQFVINASFYVNVLLLLLFCF